MLFRSQTGESDPEAKSLNHPHYISLPFYANMAGLLKRADLVISRSGAGTLTELAIVGVPSILVPYPFAAEDHQAYNAKVFVEAGAAEMFRQQQLLPETLEATVLDLLATTPESTARYEQMRSAAKSLAVIDSATQVANLLERVMGNAYC